MTDNNITDNRRAIGSVSLKRKVLALLYSDDFEDRLPELLDYPGRSTVGPLFSALCTHNELQKWRAVTSMGLVVSHMADRDMEAARVVMRRLIWQLNDESGGIGWGCPEAMGEIMARHDALAREYVHILVSYIREDGNPLEFLLLEKGVLWGIGRLAVTKPFLLRDAAPHVAPYLESADGEARGLAAWVCGLLGAASTVSRLERLLNDTAAVRLYRNLELMDLRVRDLAEEALEAVKTASVRRGHNQIIL